VRINVLITTMPIFALIVAHEYETIQNKKTVNHAACTTVITFYI